MQAKVQLSLERAWEYHADFTSIATDKARRDRLSEPDHIHNTKPYPVISDQDKNTSAVTWLHSHLTSLVNELSTSSNFQNTVANMIIMNKILCNGLVICNQATLLDDATQKESSRFYSTPFPST